MYLSTCTLFLFYIVIVFTSCHHIFGIIWAHIWVNSVLKFHPFANVHYTLHWHAVSGCEPVLGAYLYNRSWQWLRKSSSFAKWYWLFPISWHERHMWNTPYAFRTTASHFQLLFSFMTEKWWVCLSLAGCGQESQMRRTQRCLFLGGELILINTQPWNNVLFPQVGQETCGYSKINIWQLI